MRIPEQVKRLATVIGALVLMTIAVRFFVIPPRLIARDLHQSSTVEREVAKPVKFAGVTACVGCHEDVGTKKGKSFHKTVACETCHGPAANHADDPGAVKPPAPRDRKFCPVCHAYDASRPTGFPQINPTAHNPVKPCITCHNPHDPVPPHAPQECSACHGQIERTKVVSSHALLSCTTCHLAAPQHRTAPRSALPTKPETREFCGTCHSQSAPDGAPQGQPPAEAKRLAAVKSAAPKIDLSEHGGAYLCWQCHYPHLPEGRL